MKKYNPSAIKILRQAHNLTPDEFAEKIGARSKRMIVLNWEAGKQIPSVPSLLQIVNGFNVPFDIFFVDNDYLSNSNDPEK